MKKEELRSGIAEILTSLRIRKGYSKNKMAEFLGVNKRTWYQWESGEATPNIVDFIDAFLEFEEPVLRTILSKIYPDNDNSCEDIDLIRNNTSRFFSEVATDHMVRIWNFLAFGNHGSNNAPQAEEFCALNHLPMEYRYYIAEMIYVFYKTAERRGELVATDDVMPNMETWEAGLKKGQKAAFHKLQSYTTIAEDK